jgi:hypothetical protein
LGQVEKNGTLGQGVTAFEKGNKGGKTDRESGQQDVPADDPGELNARQQNRVKRQSSSPLWSSFGSAGFASAVVDHGDQPPAGVPYFARRRKIAWNFCGFIMGIRGNV